MKYNSIIIIGTTATGKTALSVQLAKSLNTEIINADSTQVYKELSIGVAKATEEEMQGVPHHLMSFLPVDASYTVSEFKMQSLQICEQLLKQNKPPIIVGGTGFYIESLLNGYTYTQSIKNETIRNKYKEMVKNEGVQAVYNSLMKVDSITAKKLHPNDTRRVIRALEIYETTGKTKSEYEVEGVKLAKNNDGILKPLIVGLTMPRQLLYEKIELRTDLMFKNGLLQEVQQLYEKGYPVSLQSLKSIGYKELYEYFEGTMPLEQAKSLIKQHTRNYAKRQVTWFKRFKNAVWFDVSQKSKEEILQEILNLFHTQ